MANSAGRAKWKTKTEVRRPSDLRCQLRRLGRGRGRGGEGGHCGMDECSSSSPPRPSSPPGITSRAHPERRRAENRRLTNPAFPTDRGDIRGTRDSGSGQRRASEGASTHAHTLARPSGESVASLLLLRIRRGTPTTLHHSRAQRRVLQPRTPPRSWQNEE